MESKVCVFCPLGLVVVKVGMGGEGFVPEGRLRLLDLLQASLCVFRKRLVALG
jgi:hypothetical protein